jgi:hypothetical protein
MQEGAGRGTEARWRKQRSSRCSELGGQKGCSLSNETGGCGSFSWVDVIISNGVRGFFCFCFCFCFYVEKETGHLFLRQQWQKNSWACPTFLKSRIKTTEQAWEESRIAILQPLSAVSYKSSSYLLTMMAKWTVSKGRIISSMVFKSFSFFPQRVI